MNYRTAEIVKELVSNGFEKITPSQVHSVILELERDVDSANRSAHQSKAREEASEKLISFHKDRVDTRTGIIMFLLIMNAGFIISLIIYLAKR